MNQWADQAQGMGSAAANGTDLTSVVTTGLNDTANNVVRLQEGGAGATQDANGFLLDAAGV